MAKQLAPTDLAEVVCGLLTNPGIFGELDSTEKHQHFMHDIGRVIAEHCGGQINHISPPDTDENYLSDQYSSPYLSVSPDDSLPSLARNVWAFHDIEGWEPELAGLNAEEAALVPDASEVRKTRAALRSLLVNKPAEVEKNEVSLPMVDWRIPEGTPVEAPGDEQPFRMIACMGNQSFIEILDENGEPRFGLVLEIDNGVPAIHIDTDGGDALLHIRAAHDGLVLTPDSDQIRFEEAPQDRYCFFSQNAKLIR